MDEKSNREIERQVKRCERCYRTRQVLKSWFDIFNVWR